MAPSTSTLLTHWSWEPSILIGLALLTAAYVYYGGLVRRRHDLGPPLTQFQITMFVIAQLVLVFALLSPLDEIGDQYLFSAHMVQHLLLASLWPPLMLLALPAWMAEKFFRWPVLGPVLSAVTLPIAALLLFNADIYVWHLPVLYDATLSNEWVHIAEHLTFMAVGIVNWWPILSPIRQQRLGDAFQVLYLFVNAMLMMVLGIVFTFAPVVFYTPYADAPRLWGISALSDQQVGGLIMWYPGNLPYVVGIIAAFYRWFDRSSEPEDDWYAAEVGPGPLA